MDKEDIRRYSIEELVEMRKRGETYTRVDAPEYDIDPEFWKNAKLVYPPAKKSVHLKLDEDVFDWFKSQGPGHLTRMQAVLRSFYEARSQ